MFNSISWQEFLSAVALIGGGYYAITALLLYGSEITTIYRLSGCAAKSCAVASVAEARRQHGAGRRGHLDIYRVKN